MKIFNFLLFIFLSSILFAQSPDVYIKNFYFCNGNIGPSKIYVYLYINKDIITGKYYYEGINQFIEIKGSISNNKFYIEEKVNNHVTGYFNGNISSNFLFSGKWSSYDGDNKYDFEFSINDEYPINNLDIITSLLVKEHSYNDSKYIFESMKDAVIIKNIKNINSIDKISLDVDGIKALSTSRVEFLLKSSIADEYRIWIESSYNNFYIKREINVSYLDTNIISFSIFNYSYTGGIHAIYNSISAIYSIDTGDRIGVDLSELIENKNDRELINLMRDKLLRVFTEKDFFDFYSIELSDIFDITPSGIKFIWPLYKIAGYSQGIIEIDFTYLELKPFIKKDSKFFYLFNK